jgi:hypothetical protein
MRATTSTGDAEEYNPDTWTEVRRWLGRHDKPRMADPGDVLTRLYNSGCIKVVLKPDGVPRG